MQVLYNSVPVVDNQRMRLSETKAQPHVLSQTNGTLIMYDPDAVGEKTYVHWIQQDGNDLLPYAPPSPPPNTGAHRYIFELYKNENNANASVIDRSMNSIADLKAQLGLNGPPLSTVYFVSENDGQGGKRMTKRRMSRRRTTNRKRMTERRKANKIKRLKRKTVGGRKRQ